MLIPERRSGCKRIIAADGSVHRDSQQAQPSGTLVKALDRPHDEPIGRATRSWSRYHRDRVARDSSSVRGSRMGAYRDWGTTDWTQRMTSEAVRRNRCIVPIETAYDFIFGGSKIHD
jgi:hypothetical protein